MLGWDMDLRIFISRETRFASSGSVILDFSKIFIATLNLVFIQYSNIVLLFRL